MFDGIYGHKRQKEMLMSSLKEDKVSHCYLFYGKEGIGKKMLAFEFAKELLECDNLDTCVDYKYICRIDGRKDILAEQIRENITDDINKKPISSKRKVYIINDAQYLNEVSQNILLKTLEEPPHYVTIIMIVSNISTMLPTILSRVSKVEFQGLGIDTMHMYTNTNGITLSDDIINFASGSIGKLEYIIKNDIISSFEKVDDIVNLILKKDKVGAILKREEVDFTNTILLEYLEFMLFKNKLYISALEIKSAISRLKMNGNYDIVIDNMLLRCIESA